MTSNETNNSSPWLQWAIELQALAQNGLAYTKDAFDKERFERIRQISAEIMCYKTGFPAEKVQDLFCSEVGYQTPKLDTRAAVFQDNKILLVCEKGKWALPGGWVDVTESVYSNTIKETKEEAGLDVKPLRLIAVQDRDKHNQPPYAYGICKIFVLCQLLGGEFIPNIETSKSGFFCLDELPALAEEKNTAEQIAMCFQAQQNEQWQVLFD